MDVKNLTANTTENKIGKKKRPLGARQDSVIKDNNSTLHILYGSRTGNSRAAAELACDYTTYLGMNGQLLDLSKLNPKDFHRLKNILLAVSTHGEGDPPAIVEDFYNFIHSSQAPGMEEVNFSILALGDSSYSDFCKTGNDFRKRFLELGAKEVHPIIECDIDFEENAKTWARDSVDVFTNYLPSEQSKQDKGFSFEINKRESDYDNAFYARVLEKKLLTKPESSKRILHVALSMENFNQQFYPGDSFGVYMNNSRILVDALLKELSYDKTFVITSGNQKKLLKDALITGYEITMITPVVVQKYAELGNNQALKDLIKNENHLNDYCRTHDVLDLVKDFPSPIQPEEFISILRNLTPRLYSVASSPLANPHELHLTVGLIEYPINNREHRGVCSTYFDDRVEVGQSIPVLLEPNDKFRLTDDDSKPVIMISTSTGIAPFRAFLQERNHRSASGENWLFFGDRHEKSDFLYQDEIEGYLKSGLLTRLTTAFSRSSNTKNYVQHQLLKHSKEVFDWIDKKDAVIYICGNKWTMGQDVKTCLEQIVAAEAGLTPQEASQYLHKIKTEKRYQMDLY